MAPPLIERVEYSIKRATRATDPPIIWDGTKPTILVQAREIAATSLTPDELTECQEKAILKQTGLEFIIRDAKLHKAGKAKYAELKATGQFKWPGSRRSSLSSADTQIIAPTTTTTTAPTTSRSVTSLLGGLASAAGKFLPGASESKPVATATAVEEPIEVSLYDSVTDSFGGAVTDDSSEEEVPRSNPTELERSQLEEVHTSQLALDISRPEELSEEELLEFQQFKAHRWANFLKPGSSPSRGATAEYVQVQCLLQQALDQPRLNLYDSDLRAINYIAEGRYPWGKLGKGPVETLVAQLFSGQFGAFSLNKRVYFTHAELYTAIRDTRQYKLAEDYWTRVLQIALTAKLQLAYQHQIFTDPQQLFKVEERISDLEKIALEVDADLYAERQQHQPQSPIITSAPNTPRVQEIDEHFDYEVSEQELLEFNEFKKYRWKRFQIVEIAGAPSSTPGPVLQCQISLAEAIREPDITGYYRKDVRALERIEQGQGPWKQLGTGTRADFFERLFFNQFTENDEGLPSRVYILYSEYSEAILNNPTLTNSPKDLAFIQRLALIAKIQVAYRFHLLTDEEEQFYTEEPLSFLKRLHSILIDPVESEDKREPPAFNPPHTPQEENLQTPQGEQPEGVMATIPLATKTALDIAKEDINQAEVSINNHGTVALDIDDVENLRAVINDAEVEIRKAVNSVYAIAGLPDTEINDHVALQKEYHNKGKALKLDLSKIQRKIAPNTPNRHGHNGPHGIPLPKIELTKFNGDWQSWLSFKDLFNVTVMSRPDDEIDPVHKFQLLRQSLLGPAHQLISSIPVTGANLKRAWDALMERYNNPRELLQSYVDDMERMKIESPTADKLRSTYERINNDRESLRGLQVEVEKCDPLLVTKFASSFDFETKAYYEMYLALKTDKSPPTWKDIGEVINCRCRALENLPRHAKGTKPQPQIRRTAMTVQQSSFNNYRSPPACFMCSSYHWLRDCDRFKRLTVEGRSKFVRERQLCVNCFSPSHNGKSCQSSNSCRDCGGRHNTLLHFKKGVPPQGWTPSNRPAVAHNRNAVVHNRPPVAQNRPRGAPNRPREPQVQANASTSFRHVLLPTVQVLVKNASDEMIPCRALLDTGSQSTFISERAVQQLRLQRYATNVQLSGIGNSTSVRSKGYAILALQSIMDENEEFTTKALILPQVTADTPGFKLPAGSWEHLRGLQLADPKFHVPGKIDIVLGADIVFGCFTGARIIGKQNQPVAHSTSFGWVVGGPSHVLRSTSHINSNLVTSANLSLGTLQQFWGAEALKEEINEYKNDEEAKCEEIFRSTTRRCNDGKLEVSFPFKTDPPDVGQSKEIAIRRLAGTEARLSRNPELRLQYEAFMNDYEAQGHMVEVQEDGAQDVYLPHHPIIRTTVLTTKVRVVFDASAKTSNGKSLNDAQLVGPVIQDDLFSILTRFRLHKVAINGDIEKMYRQIWISPHHRDYQRILWRRKPQDPISMFQLKTVTYGTASAPWLATRALKYIAEKEQKQHPEAARIIANDHYMDDLLSGADSQEEAHKIQKEVTELLKSYGLPLRKWASNSEYVIRAISGEQDMLTNPEEIVKTLGLKWNSKLDAFQFSVTIKEIPKLTKRAMISEIACTFDPLGFAAPVMVLAKILYQEVWTTSTEWDDELPANIGQKYEALRAQLAGLEAMTIPRWLGTIKADQLELHVFTDASEKAYGACLYLRQINNNGVSSNLVASKTRVAPLKTVSLPRLELMGAVLGAQLMEQVAKAFRRPVQDKYYWSDSTITLAWIKSQPGRFKTFIANRVATIQEVTLKEDWRHVGTKENPADLCSRGIYPNEMKGAVLEMWLKGPPWLQAGELPMAVSIPEPQEELKKVQALHSTPIRNRTIELIESCSSFGKLCRITAIFGRLRSKQAWDLKSVLNPEERNKAFLRLVSVVQSQEWVREINALAKARDSSATSEEVIRVMKGSNISNLNPILDERRILRVGGRLSHSDLEYTAKHPAILPYGHLAKCYLRYLHVKNLHVGPTLLLAKARQEVWIIRGPQLAREVVKKCVDCTRWRGTALQQQMADLPSSRTTGHRAFNVTGVDYAGPVLLKTRKGRGGTTVKTWVAVFVCFSTKAVHLELVSELSSEAFIAALRRFIARRGIPAEINSDNGTNFVGTYKELKSLLSEEKGQGRIMEAASQEGIKFNFIPPAAPHHGGLWEAAVKSTKHHLKRVLGAAMLTFEEMATVLCQIEAQLNSRPLCPLTEDPTNLDILTPGHFLIGQSLTTAPDPCLAHIKENRLGRWQYLQRLQQEFWSKWHLEYLAGLQRRYKWKYPQESIKVDTLVLIKEDHLAPTQWRRGRVMELHPGSDGQTRVVTLRTAHGEVTRPIVKLVPLVAD